MKDKYCTFGVGVSEKTKHGDSSIKGEISLNRSEAAGRWILHFSKSNYFARDYRLAVRSIQSLVDGHFGYLDDIEDLGHTKILNIIKSGWDKGILELISTLDSFVDYVSPANNYYYQEVIDGKVVYRPSPLVLPDQLPLYSIEEAVETSQNAPSTVITRI